MKTVLIVLTFAAAALAASAIQPGNLRCEYRTNPQGIDVTEPRLSWILTGASPTARGVRQTAYRILASSSEAGLKSGTGDLWDSGKVTSAQSIQVVYHGKPLNSGALVFWKVQIWDQDGKAAWSAPAQWTMGLLHPADWKAKWIGRDEPGVYQAPDSRYQILRAARWIWNAPNAGDGYFRRQFTIPADRKITRAVSIAAGAANAEAFVNGESVSKSDATLPPVVDIAPLLHAGENAIAIHAAHPRGERPAGVIAIVRVEFDSGEPLLIQTDNRWRTASKVEDGWQKPGYLDIAWPPAQELGAYGMPPWGPIGIAAEHRLPGRLLRKEFTPDRKVRRAAVYMAGLGVSELYLNGSKVGDHVLSPGLTDYDKHVLYVTYDVTRQMVAGTNAIGVMLGNGRYYAPRNQAGTRSFGYPKALVQLDIEYEDGSRASIVSDETWKLTSEGPIRANNEYDGEEYDARMELAGWNRAGFNDSAWDAAHTVAAPSGAVVAEMAEPLRVTDTLKPLSVKQLKPGTYIFDMGQNMVGWCRLHVSGAKGATVQLRHAETLKPDGSLYLDNLRTAQATDLYTLKGEGVEVWEPRFTYHGFRFVEVTGFPGTPTLASLEGRVVHDDMEKTADFTSSNTLLNQIHHNVFWGIAGNYRSIPTDCPQRDERQGWLGDRSQVSRSESYMFDVAAFYSKWTTDLADSQRPNGAIPDVSPNYWPNYNDDLTWPSTFIFVPGMLYDEYNDKRVLEHYYPAMRQWLDHIKTYVQPDGLIAKDTYADWCVPPEDPKLIHSQDPARVTDKALIASSYYYELLRVIARYARILDKPTEAADLESQASAVSNAFQMRFFKPSENIYGNGTQTSSVLPLYFNMVPQENRAAVVASLARNIEEVTHGHVGTGLVGAQWLMRTLTDNGRGDLAYTVATQKTYPGWGYMVDQGATTVWELWNGNTADPAMNSGNHVMQIGDLAVWMYEYLAGIRSDPEKPGFQHILIRPYPAGDLTSVSASHKSMYGSIATAWKRDANSFTLNVTVPPNTSATVWLPAQEGAKLTESKKPAAAAKGVKFLRNENGSALFEVESGTYAFKAER
ncbi:MAG TPA: family 78 glycoside hydrolase catalytic domain [Candidatus Sulfopaludibacter sp.]|jgi:alpha-L-rhamnosidase|nr:family 78 glycoside hydrolase catalytic domain [Candidatus Sulfopaludibacter sp.]